MAGKVKLTERQKQHLLVLSGGERKAHPGLHNGVLNSLSLKGLVFARHDTFNEMPTWQITPAGRAHLASSGKTGSKMSIAEYVRTHLCPNCAAFLEKKALTDSDQRIHASWSYCPDCGWDERRASSGKDD